MVKIGLVQAGAVRDAEANLETLRQFARQAKAQGCAALCFPEAFLTGYFPEEAALLSLDADAPILAQTAAAARETGIDLLVGFMERSAGACYLTQGIFRPDGTRSFYRKTHLGQKEQRFFAPGDALPVYPLSCGITIGIQMCVELHFPEITQTLSLRGAQVIFAPHAIPRAAGPRQALWNKLLPARSYDNRVYMACCNQWDPQRFGGGCMVTDPRGEILAACFDEESALLTAEIDVDALNRYHQEGPLSARYYPERRRPELYK